MSGDRIILMDCDCPSIYFPVGPPAAGGTCAFATPVCMEHCPSGLVVNAIERQALAFFRQNDHEVIIRRLRAEFTDLMQSPRTERLLQWFTWGDCLPDLTDRVAAVITGLHANGIPQYGFTRNRGLWEALPCLASLHMGLTVDDIDEALALSMSEGRMTACPDYETGYAQMVFSGKVRCRCSGWWCITEAGEVRNSDCTQCLAAGQGCFYRKGQQLADVGEKEAGT